VTRPALVTGAGGFIGSRLVSRLREAGQPVRALLLPAEPVPAAWDEDVEIIRGDITDTSARSRAADGAGSVFHLAAVVGDWGPEALFRRVTVEGTRGMLEVAARNRSRFVLASSIVVYGHRLGREPCVEALPHGRAFGPYGRSKQAQERLARDWLDRGTDVRIVRPANVFGPGSRVWVDEVIRLLRTGTPTLIDGGRGNAGLVHVDNVVDILVRAASDRARPGDVFNACDELVVSWRRYFSDLAALAKTRPPRSLPSWLAWPLASTMEPLWRLARSAKRPPLTREALQLVSSDHRVPAERAREVLGHGSLLDYSQAMDGLSEYAARSGMPGTGPSG
jgi:nucleoside-diphosphate-sugar epimerase